MVCRIVFPFPFFEQHDILSIYIVEDIVFQK